MDKKYTFAELRDIVARLRAPGGCPWDRELKIEDMKNYVMEESYEVIDAIDGPRESLADELGDLLLQIMLLSQICSEEKSFDVNDVITMISEKMIRRHPHVFGDVKADTSEQVLKNWDKIKSGEKHMSTVTDRLKDVTKTLPALLKAEKVQNRAAKVGFDWDNIEDTLKKLEEEVAELRQAVENKDEENIFEEMGDTLFAAVNVSRFARVNPELALGGSINKFVNRFEYVETKAAAEGRNLEEMTLSEMDKLWDEAKEKGIK